MITSLVMTASSLSYCWVSVASAILCEVWVISPSVLAVMREKRAKRVKVRMGKCMIGSAWLFFLVTLAVDWMWRWGCGMLWFEHILGRMDDLFVYCCSSDCRFSASQELEDDTGFQDISRENHASLTFCPTVVHDVGLAE